MWLFGKRKVADPPDPELALAYRIVRLDEEITEATAQIAIAQLLFLQHQDARQPITLRIGSLGGSVVAGLAVIDAVREIRPPVHTRAPEQAHGMAAVVLASGRRGERVVGRTAEVSLSPTRSAATVMGAEVDRGRQVLAQVLAELCGQPAEAVTHDLTVGRWFTPAETIIYGLADRVER